MLLNLRARRRSARALRGICAAVRNEWFFYGLFFVLDLPDFCSAGVKIECGDAIGRQPLLFWKEVLRRGCHGMGVGELRQSAIEQLLKRCPFAPLHPVLLVHIVLVVGIRPLLGPERLVWER